MGITREREIEGRDVSSTDSSNITGIWEAKL